MLGLASSHTSISPVPHNEEERTHSLYFANGEIGVQSGEVTPQITQEVNGLAEVQSEALLAVLRLSQAYSWEKREGVLLAGERESWELKFPERAEGEARAVSPGNGPPEES